MNLPVHETETCRVVDAVLATEQLAERKTRSPDYGRETRITLELLNRLVTSPADFFVRLVQAARQLTQAESTGISLLDEDEKRFVWPAVYGPLDSYLWDGTPRDFGPCGTVLDRDSALLFQHPERYFTYLRPIKPPLEEVLLVPFHVDGKAVGTIWAVIHTAGRQFDAEDKRLLESLSRFAASAYGVLVQTGSLAPFLKQQAEPRVAVS